MTTAETVDRLAPASAPPRRRRRSRQWLYILPAGIFLAALSIYPLVQLVRMSLSDVSVQNLHGEWPFVGLQNFIDGLEAGTLQAGLGRTLVFVSLVTALGLAIGIGAAVALRGRSRVSGAIMALMVFIWALPPVVNGSVWKFLLAEDGLLNTVITAFGVEPFPFLYDARYALVSVAIVNAWAVIPFNALVFRAAILNIPDELFEAAQLDGANPTQEFRHIILPSLFPTTIVLAVLTVVYAFRSFDFVYVMTKGGPGVATQTLPYMSFQQAFIGYDFSAGAATAVVTVALVIVLAGVYARSVLKEERE
ncbi:MAG TPA: sugar ABC transporter permease [Microbacterium sp.]|uniref:carbohydrate ABC transporter permease n=1 Tax=Microbacterium sp. TaxID=51671 RepID=UPI002B5544C2|nr:sugar ABC transporter permease [Microbacterium sp.]HWI30064.1 sugar ABC transporter permease [Microbacterium sp.]